MLHEIATDGHRRIEIEEAAVPVEEAVAAGQMVVRPAPAWRSILV